MVVATTTVIKGCIQAHFVYHHSSPQVNTKMSYLLAINCGSSSIKGKLYHLPQSTNDPLSQAANLSVSNISSKGEKIKIKISWNEEEGRDVSEEGDDGDDVECELSSPGLCEGDLADR